MTEDGDIVIRAAELERLQDLVRRSGDDGKYGLTDAGFTPKPYVQLLKESMAAARAMMGADLDLAPGSAVRKMLELAALENARTYAHMAAMADDLFVATARGPALSRLGEELGVPRPFVRATGSVQLTLDVDAATLQIPRGARLTSADGKAHAFTLEAVELTAGAKTVTAPVQAFFPGPAGNYPAATLARWNGGADPDGAHSDKLMALRQLAEAQGKSLDAVVVITQAAPLRDGSDRWSDDTYRELLLRMPRSVWTAESIQAAVSVLPGVGRAAVQDQFGGLDLDRSIFGDFNFLDRVFAAERDLASPYAFTILVWPEEGAIWSGPGGLLEQILDAVEDLRPIGLFPRVKRATSTYVMVRARVHVRGLPLPSGGQTAMNGSAPARALKKRLLQRVDSYISSLDFNSTVRAAKIEYQLMSDPNVVDVQDLEILHGAGASILTGAPTGLGVGRNLRPSAESIPVLVDTDDHLTLVAAS